MNYTSQLIRSSIACILSLVAFCFTGFQAWPTVAQVVATQGSNLEEAQEFLGNYGTLYTMTITPAAEPIPAFKYRLVVPPHKTTAGNAVTHYLRSLALDSFSRSWEDAWKEYGGETVDAWQQLSTPSNEIPIDDLQKVSSSFDFYVDNYIRRATRCRYADWTLALEDMSGLEMYSLLLPGVQQSREIAVILSLRNRLAIIEGRHEDSIEHIKMIYKLGESVNENGFIVANLAAAREVSMANECMIDLIASPNSPNMYWALAELPRPILSFRKAMRLESNLSERFFPELNDVETAEYSVEQWKQLLLTTTDTVTAVRAIIGTSETANPKLQMQDELLAMAAGLVAYPSAKQRLLDAGLGEERVKAMSVSQTLLVDFKRDCDYFANEFEKTLHVPYQDSLDFADRAEGLLYPVSMSRFGAIMATMVLQPNQSIRRVGYHIQVEIDSLMVIEAIRNHATTKGEFPKSLDDLDLPVRQNLLTGKPFGYRIKDGNAVLDVQADSRSKRFVISIANQNSAAEQQAEQGSD